MYAFKKHKFTTIMYHSNFIYLIGTIFKHMLIGFDPEVYLDTKIGTKIFTAYIPVDKTIISSLGIPISTSFKVTKEVLNDANPN